MNQELSFSFDELLENPKYDRTLIVNGRRCHGGFDKDGNYQSPRTIWRNPAIKAWQEQHLATSSLPLVEVPREVVPPYTPNVAQARFLLKNGVREPLVRILTEIAIVEGFGAFIRELPVPALKSFIREDVAGTALAHLTGGLFEAHARDEAGWDAEGGHKQMWEAARDAALSNPTISPEIFAAIMSRRSATPPQALFPELGEPVERLDSLYGRCARDRGLRGVDLRMGRGGSLGSRNIRRARGRGQSGSLHPQRRSSARRVSAHRAFRDQRAHAADSGRQGNRRQRVVDALMDRTLKNMMRQRAVDRPAMIRELIRNNAQRKRCRTVCSRNSNRSGPHGSRLRDSHPKPTPPPQA